MSYAIDSFGFVRWLGSPPQLVTDHMAVFTKPGQPGVSAQLLGEHGEPFEVELHAAFADQLLGSFAEKNYRNLVTAGPVVVVYNGVNYYSAHQHRYLVMSVKTVDFRRHPRLLGLGYDYFGGWLLRSRWQLLPVAQ